MRKLLIPIILAAVTITLTACGVAVAVAQAAHTAVLQQAVGASGSSTTTTSTNAAPEFDDLASTISVNENQTSITTVEATDADSDTLSFSLSGGDAQDLSIDSQTGVLIFLSAPDYETKTTYQTDVVVSDGTTSTTQAITIEIVDIAETSGEAPLEINVTVAVVQTVTAAAISITSMASRSSPTLRWKRARPIVFCRAIPPIQLTSMRLSLQADGTHGGGSEYTSNIDYVGSTGSSGAYLQFTVPADIDTETLYYYCLPFWDGRTIFITGATGTGYEIVGMN